MERALTNKKRRILSIALLLLLGPIALELWRPGAVTNLPLVREVKVRWYAMRLGDSDSKIQASAAHALGRMGPKAKRAVPALIEALDDRRRDVRDAAAQALRSIGPGAEAVPALIAALDSGRPEVRDAAARALGEIGPDAEAAVESLIRIQKTKREYLTVEKALGQIGEPGVDPFLSELQDKSPSVREQAAKSLGRIFLVTPEPRLAKRAMPPLINALQDEDVRVCKAAAMAMQGIVTVIEVPETRRAAAEALIRAMKDRRVSPYATGALVKIADAGLEPLLSALEGEDTPERHVDADVEDPESRGTTVERLIRLMADREEMEGFGAEVLRQMGESALEPLIMASKDEDARVRKAAAMALQRVVVTVNVPETRARIVEFLISALQDEDVPLRRTGAAAMQHVLPAVKDPQILARAAEALVRALNDSDAEVRSYAPIALGKIGELAVEPLLRMVLEEDTQERTPSHAAFALGLSLGTAEDTDLTRRVTKRLIDRLQDESRSDARRAQDASTLGEILSGVKDPGLLQIVEALVEALKDDSQKVREHAAFALSRLPRGDAGQRVTGRVIEAFLDEELDPTTDLAGLQLSELLKKADAEARDTVRRYLSKPGAPFAVRLRAAMSLAQSGESSPLVTETIKQALQDDKKTLQVSAVLLGMSRFEGDLAGYIEPLSRLLLGSKHNYIRRSAGQRMAEIGEPALDDILRACKSDDWTVQIFGLSALALFCYSVMDQRSSSRSKYRTFRRELWSGSTDSLFDKVSPVLAGLLKADNPSVVSSALRAVAPFGDQGTQLAAKVPLEPLIARLADPNESPRVHTAVIEVLGKTIAASKSLEFARAAVPLVIVALEDKRRALGFPASLALGRIVSAVEDRKLAREAVPPLITALKDSNPSVRAHAAESLGRIFAAVPDPVLAKTAIEPLLRALEDADSDSRGSFAWALTQIATEEAREAVRNAGFDPDQPPTLPKRRY